MYAYVSLIYIPQIEKLVNYKDTKRFYCELYYIPEIYVLFSVPKWKEPYCSFI